MQGVELALAQAVEAVDAARVVYAVTGNVDAGGLAAAFAEPAVLAFCGVDLRTEHREAREETQRGAHRADGIAVSASVLPCQDNQRDEGYGRHDEGGQALHPDINRIEGIAVPPLREGGQDIVPETVYRLEQVRNYAAPGAVRCQQGHESLHAEYQCQHEQAEDDVPQPFLFAGIAEAEAFFAFLPAAAEP